MCYLRAATAFCRFFTRLVNVTSCFFRPAINVLTSSESAATAAVASSAASAAWIAASVASCAAVAASLAASSAASADAFVTATSDVIFVPTSAAARSAVAAPPAVPLRVHVCE